MTQRSFLKGLFALLAAPFAKKAVAQPTSNPNQAKYEEMVARTLAALPYERISVPGKEAYQHWQRIKGEGRGWPVIIGNDEDLNRIAEQFSIDELELFGANQPEPPPGLDIPLPPMPKPRPPEQILAKAEAVAIPAALKQEFEHEYGDDYEPEAGNWPDYAIANQGPEVGLSVAMDIVTGEPHETVHILVIPAEQGWEVPAYLRWGNWNACPPPEVHVAALRSWNERYGAELVGISGDVLNLIVSSRPQTKEEATELAYEQFYYCSDIVDQGVGTIANLAANLKAQDWWFFWWD